MSDFLKGNFKTARPIVEDSSQKEKEDIGTQLRKKALNSIGGSMVYVERTALEWDGADE